MRNLKRTLAACGLVLALLSVGCTDNNVGIVSGTVMIDGEPASTGSISFAPTDGKTAPAGGMIEEGRFEVTLPVGTSRIEIRVPRIIGKTKIYNTEDSPIQDIMEESLPAEYNDETELTYDVPPGKSEKNFDLTAKKKSKRR